ncbi:MAG: methyl-accepting chemotaxis protein [Treponema sp.]|nr:methyl-accepting chemotaxis protein [Treponema sp.]
MKIKYKLSIMVISIMALVMAGLSVIVVIQARSISLDLSLRGLQSVTQNEATYWSGRENGYIQVLKTLGNIMAGYEDLAPERRRDIYDEILFNLVSREANIVALYTIWKPNAIDGMDQAHIGRLGSSPQGQYAISYTRESGHLEAQFAEADLLESMAYFNGPGSKRDRVENPIFREIGGVPQLVFRVMVPIVNPRTNETVGGVGALLSTAAMQAQVEETIAHHEEISLMIIYSNNGTILAHFIPQRIGAQMTDVDMEHGPNMDAASRAVREGEPFFAITYDPTLDTYVEYFMEPIEIGNSGHYWSVVIGTADAVIYREANDLTLFVVTLAVAAMGISALIVYVVLNLMTKPIVTVTDTLKDIAQGEGDLTRNITVSSHDEIGDLATYFNQTLDKIKTLVVTIKGQTGVMSDLGTELASNMTETAAAINQITANVQSIKGRIVNQSASVTQTNATMEQITVNIDRLNGHVENQSSNITQASSAIEEMVANIQSVNQTLVHNANNVKMLMEASEIGRSGLSGVAQDIQEIAKESEGLLEINSVMENIASQTNLLSMNAAIEAAHAGDAGKGFAVVADEIRKLAENSSHQSKTISAVLKKIKTSIDKITSSTDNVLNRFESIDNCIKTVAQEEENIRNAMEEQNTGSKQLLQGVGNVNDLTRHVRSGSEEMLEGSKEVIKEGKNLELMTQEITGGMNEMAAGADQINTAVTRVNELSSKNRENIDLLVREVSRFKV